MAIRVIVEVSGGVVQQVYASSADIVVEVLDHDNLNDIDTIPDDRKKAEKLQKEMESMIVVY